MLFNALLGTYPVDTFEDFEWAVDEMNADLGWGVNVYDIYSMLEEDGSYDQFVAPLYEEDML